MSVKIYSLSDTSGYAHTAREIIVDLARAGIGVSWAPLVPSNRRGRLFDISDKISDERPEIQAAWRRDIPCDVVLAHTIPDFLPEIRDREPNKRIVLSTVWETDLLPSRWKPWLEIASHILVPCRWNREVFVSGGVGKPISVVPHLPVFDIDPVSVPLSGIKNSTYVFYTIGMWTTRKGIADAIEAFYDAFAENDDVSLVVKTSRHDWTQSSSLPWLHSSRRAFWIMRRKRRGLPAVRFVDRDLADQEIHAIHRRGDCYFSLCRSEGWGLGAYDAACLGKPVLVTGHGGHLDYLPPDLAYHVDYDLVPVRTRDPAFCDGHGPGEHWAQPKKEHAAGLLRHVFANRQEAARKGNLLREHLMRQFQREEITRGLIDILRTAAR